MLLLLPQKRTNEKQKYKLDKKRNIKIVISRYYSWFLYFIALHSYKDFLKKKKLVSNLNLFYVIDIYCDLFFLNINSIYW